MGPLSFQLPPAMPKLLETRAPEVLLGIVLLVVGTREPLNLQSIAPSRVCPAAEGAAESECIEGDNPDLDNPIWWFDAAGMRTQERECTPKRLRRCGASALAYC